MDQLLLVRKLISMDQQLSHLSQVFGVRYMNQKRITPDRAHEPKENFKLLINEFEIN